MNSQNKEFVELQEQWYKKLKDSGFDDIEKNETYLIVNSSSKFNSKRNQVGSMQNVIDGINSRTEYYRIAGHFLYDYKFANDLDKFIWELHSEGISVRNITLKLKEKGIDLCRASAGVKLLGLKKEMIKLYGIDS
jgi:hypothetical protein